jgi:hypothetical protein
MLLIFIVDVIGVSHLMGATLEGNQVSHVLIVVDFNSGYVLRMMSQRDLRIPSGEALWRIALATISTQQLELFPEPTGPISPRTNESD